MFLGWLWVAVEFFEVVADGFGWLWVVPSFSNYG